MRNLESRPGAPATTTVTLLPVSAEAGAAMAANQPPPGVRVAPDYPTEFSAGVGQQASAGLDRALGPFFIHRTEDGVVVGEIGGAFTGPGQVEIGYAIVTSCWGRGYATAAVRSFVERARAVPGVARFVGHTPLDRPASGRVLEKAGFRVAAEIDDEHEGVQIRVVEWELTPS
jgi:RimJ/RimL family protein N-acetyltransferase